jgi:hypothetical protein
MEDATARQECLMWALLERDFAPQFPRNDEGGMECDGFVDCIMKHVERCMSDPECSFTPEFLKPGEPYAWEDYSCERLWNEDGSAKQVGEFEEEDYDPDIFVATANIWSGGDKFPLRLKGIAQGFLKMTPSINSIGLLGLQEAIKMKREWIGTTPSKKKAVKTKCLEGPKRKCYGPRCLMQELGTCNAASTKRSVGAVIGCDWKVIAKDKLELESATQGYEEATGVDFDTGNFLLSMILEHRTGWKLNFAVTHLYADKDNDRAIHNAEKIVRKMQEIDHVLPGYLPPILVADFNGYRTYPYPDSCTPPEPSSAILELEKHFWRPMDIIYNMCIHGRPPNCSHDAVYIGKHSSFPYSSGTYQVLEHRGLKLVDKVLIEGYEGEGPLQLSDVHNANGFLLKVLEHKNTPPFKLSTCQYMSDHPNTVAVYGTITGKISFMYLMSPGIMLGLIGFAVHFLHKRRNIRTDGDTSMDSSANGDMDESKSAASALARLGLGFIVKKRKVGVLQVFHSAAKHTDNVDDAASTIQLPLPSTPYIRDQSAARAPAMTVKAYHESNVINPFL